MESNNKNSRNTNSNYKSQSLSDFISKAILVALTVKLILWIL